MNERGVVLLLALVAFAAVYFAALPAVLEGSTPPERDARREAEAALDAWIGAAQRYVERTRRVPSSLDALADVRASRLDPFHSSAPLALDASSSGWRLRSRGPDASLGTKDDLVRSIEWRGVGETVTRERLAGIRMRYLATAAGGAELKKADRARLQSALRECWSKRARGDQNGLRRAQRVVRDLRLRLKTPADESVKPAWDRDGAGRAWTHAVDGWFSAGSDGKVGTRDDR